jgi:hypothetical protein
VKVSDSNEIIEMSADYVICTIPIGVIKSKRDEMFVPRWPERKVNDIGYFYLVFVLFSGVFL